MNFPSQQRGFTLIELMVAATLGMFLLLGLYSIFATVRNTLQSQELLAQLQDDERLTINIIANVVQSSGFYPNPTAVTRMSAFPTVAPFTAPGQVVFGTHAAAAPGDTITTQFVADTGAPSKTIDCLGAASTAGAVEINTLSISAAHQLTCTIGTGATAVTAPLIGAATTGPGIQSMQVQYGVDPGGTGSVTRYETADNVTANSHWAYVRSVYVTVLFMNPRAGRAGEPDTFSVGSEIAVQNTL